MNNVGMFVDVDNLYHNIKTSYGDDAKLNYAKYLEFISDLYDVGFKHAWMVKSRNDRLESVLVGSGFIVHKTKVRNFKVRHSVPLSLEITKMISVYEVVIIGSSNPDLETLIEYLKTLGIKVIVFASRIPQFMKCDKLEIPLSLIRE